MHLFRSSMRTPICLAVSAFLSGTYRLSRKSAWKKINLNDYFFKEFEKWGNGVTCEKKSST